MHSHETLEQDAVVQELRRDPEIDAAHIGVSVQDGAVTLTGHVHSYQERVVAERAAKRVCGVTAVANELDVHLEAKGQRDDTDIAVDLVHVFAMNVNVPRGTVQASVHHGWVTLQGIVTWAYQREAAAEAARHVRGVRGVTNAIELRNSPVVRDIEKEIWTALRRCEGVDPGDIHVSLSNGVATLRGRVSSWAEAGAARRAAASAAGVREVRLDLDVRPL